MEQYIMDGEVHRLSDKLGYIMKKLSCENADIREEKIKLLERYVEYLYENDRKRAMERLMQSFVMNLDKKIDGVEFVYRDAHLSGYLAQFATLALKFERVEKDNLGEREE